jgi:hypothetical protein
MNQHQRNKQQWLKRYSDEFQSVWESDELTNQEKLAKLTQLGIPTVRKHYTWAYTTARWTYELIQANQQ